jgi:hypothetical protein
MPRGLWAIVIGALPFGRRAFLRAAGRREAA